MINIAWRSLRTKYLIGEYELREMSQGVIYNKPDGSRDRLSCARRHINKRCNGTSERCVRLSQPTIGHVGRHTIVGTSREVQASGGESVGGPWSC